jgi:hypothetical protein
MNVIKAGFSQISLQLLIAESFAIQAKGTDGPIELVVGIGNHTRKMESAEML